MGESTYYQRNRDVILNRANDLEIMQEVNTEIYLKKKKIKRENMGNIEVIIRLKKTNKD